MELHPPHKFNIGSYVTWEHSLTFNEPPMFGEVISIEHIYHVASPGLQIKEWVKESELTLAVRPGCDHLDLSGLSWFNHFPYCPRCGKTETSND